MWSFLVVSFNAMERSPCIDASLDWVVFAREWRSIYHQEGRLIGLFSLFLWLIRSCQHADHWTPLSNGSRINLDWQLYIAEYELVMPQKFINFEVDGVSSFMEWSACYPVSQNMLSNLWNKEQHWGQELDKKWLDDEWSPIALMIFLCHFVGMDSNHTIQNSTRIAPPLQCETFWTLDRNFEHIGMCIAFWFAMF